VKLFIFTITIGIWSTACNFRDQMAELHPGQALVDSLYQQSKSQLFQDSAQTRERIRQLIKLADSTGYQHGHAKALFLSAYLFERYDKLNLALTDYLKCLEISEKLDQPDLLLKTYANIGLVFYKARDYKDAIEYFNQGKEKAIKQLNYSQIVNFYSYMGLCFWRANDNLEALNYYKEAIRIVKDNYKEGKKLAKLYNLIGIAFDKMESFDSSRYYFSKALQAFKDGNDKEVTESQIINNLGQSYFLENNFKKATEVLIQSLKINSGKGVQDFELISIASNNLGEIALWENDTTKALEYFVRVEKNTSISIFHPEIIRARVNLINIYEEQNDIINALKYSKVNNKGIEKLVNMIDRLRTLNVQFKLKKVIDEAREKEKQAQLKKERIYYWLSLSALVIGLSAIGYRWRKYFNKWRKLKDKYNHFATKYNDFRAKVNAAVAAQLKLNRELGTLADIEIRDQSEYLWKNTNDDDDDTEK